LKGNLTWFVNGLSMTHSPAPFQSSDLFFSYKYVLNMNYLTRQDIRPKISLVAQLYHRDVQEYSQGVYFQPLYLLLPHHVTEPQVWR